VRLGQSSRRERNRTVPASCSLGISAASFAGVSGQIDLGDAQGIATRSAMHTGVLMQLALAHALGAERCERRRAIRKCRISGAGTSVVVGIR
jgi:hypothetical protein